MSEQKSWFERNPKKTLFAALSVFLVIALAATEFILEQNLPEQTQAPKRSIRLKEHAPLINGTHRASKKGLKKRYGLTVDNLEEKDYVFRTDENGFIMPGKVHEEPDLSMVFLGGSTTECNFVEEDSRFPYLAGAKLGEKLGKKINSCNAGVSGSNTMHCLDVLINKVLPMRPDVAFLMENVNDVNIMLFFSGSYWNESPSRSLITTGKQVEKGRAQRLWEAFTQSVFPGISYRMRALLPEEQNVDEFEKERRIGLVTKDFTPRDYEANLATFVAVCKSHGIVPVLMTQFNRLAAEPDETTDKNMRKFEKDWGVDYATYKGHLDVFNESVRKIAREQNAVLIDLDKQVPKESAYMYDIVHLNTAGSQLVANIIAEQLALSSVFQDAITRKAQATNHIMSVK